MSERLRPLEDEVASRATLVFNKVRDVPYVLGLDGDPNKLFTENAGNCTRKGLYLAYALRKLGYKSLLGFAEFDWRQMPIPPEISSILKDPIDTHLFLFVNRGGKEMVLDASWDLGMPDGFPKCYWDGKSSTDIGVSGRLSGTESVDIFIAKMAIREPLVVVRRFLKKDPPTPFNVAFNTWLGRRFPGH